MTAALATGPGTVVASLKTNVQGAGNLCPRRTALICEVTPERTQKTDHIPNRRQACVQVAGIAAGAAALLDVPEALAVETANLGFKKDLNKRRRVVVQDADYKDGPQGLRYYDFKVGSGQEAVPGERVAIHFDCRWRGITFVTSRQGMGVTGGTPFGFDLGTREGMAGSTLKGLDLGVRGMRVGGLRRLKVPPELAYGNKQVGEIPPGATLDIDVELLSIKQNPFGR